MSTPSVNGIPIVPIYGTPVKTSVDLSLRVLDLKRIMYRQIYQEAREAYENKLISAEDFEAVQDKRTLSCQEYMCYFVSAVGLDFGEEQNRDKIKLLAAASANVALAKLEAHQDEVVSYLAKNCKFELIFDGPKIKFHMTSI